MKNNKTTDRKPYFIWFFLMCCFSAQALDSLNSTRRINANIKPITDSLISSATAGSAEDQYQLALAYFHVDDRENGEKWIKSSSDTGHKKASYVYGAFFASRAENQLAFQRYKISADAGYPPALHQMGLTYLYGGQNGVNVPKDPAQASEYFRQAVLSAQGSLRSQARLARQYFEGEGVPQNTNIAYHLYLDAGQKGLYRSYSRLALDWHDQGGLDPNPEKYNTYWDIFKHNKDRDVCEEVQGGQGDYQCGGEHKWLHEVFLHFEQYM